MEIRNRSDTTSERDQMTSCKGVRIGEGVPGRSDSGVHRSDSEKMVTGARDRDIGTQPFHAAVNQAGARLGFTVD